jgi:hypothetical protein
MGRLPTIITNTIQFSISTTQCGSRFLAREGMLALRALLNPLGTSHAKPQPMAMTARNGEGLTANNNHNNHNNSNSNHNHNNLNSNSNVVEHVHSFRPLCVWVLLTSLGQEGDFLLQPQRTTSSSTIDPYLKRLTSLAPEARPTLPAASTTAGSNNSSSSSTPPRRTVLARSSSRQPRKTQMPPLPKGGGNLALIHVLFLICSKYHRNTVADQEHRVS